MYSKEQWERTKAYFESGQYSLSEISEKTGISKSKISEKSKKEQWERGKNADYIEAKKTIAIKKGTEKGTALQVLDDIADEQIRRQKLIYGNAELLASQIPIIVQNTTDIEIDKETGEIIKRTALLPSDIKTLAEANDKIAITLKIAERHSTSQVNIQNTNAQQNQIQKIERVIVDTAN